MNYVRSHILVSTGTGCSSSNSHTIISRFEEELKAQRRLVKNALYHKIAEAEANGAPEEELRAILGKAASKRGIFEGDIEGGELEIGQIASSVSDILPASDIIRHLMTGFRKAQGRLQDIGV